MQSSRVLPGGLRTVGIARPSGKLQYSKRSETSSTIHGLLTTSDGTWKPIFMAGAAGETKGVGTSRPVQSRLHWQTWGAEGSGRCGTLGKWNKAFENE